MPLEALADFLRRSRTEQPAAAAPPMVLATTTPEAGDQAATAKPEGTPMLCEITDVMAQPDAYVCIWRDGELYVEPVGVPSEATEADALIAA